jgi:hypothetical protein
MFKFKGMAKFSQGNKETIMSQAKSESNIQELQKEKSGYNPNPQKVWTIHSRMQIVLIQYRALGKLIK